MINHVVVTVVVAVVVVVAVAVVAVAVVAVAVVAVAVVAVVVVVEVSRTRNSLERKLKNDVFHQNLCWWQFFVEKMKTSNINLFPNLTKKPQNVSLIRMRERERE